MGEDIERSQLAVEPSAAAPEPEGVRRFTYAIGDVQGCFDDLLRLLDVLDFDPSLDRLWFTGDLVNKGPNSLELLRFVKTLADSAISVLGNHDLYLLAAAAGAIKVRKKDTIAEILNAPDCEELLFWLRHQPLLHQDARLGYAMVHAGLPPQWAPEQAHSYARELEAVLQNFDYEDFFAHMGGEKPLQWDEDLKGWERLRFIANCFTQLRYCDREGRLDLGGRRRRGSGKKRSIPWFLVPERASSEMRILFGHWATLDAKSAKNQRVYPLDTGCANGGRFTAFRLEDARYFRVPCKNQAVPWPSESAADL